MLNDGLERKKFSELFNFIVMTPLQKHAAELNLCPHCHAKTLTEKSEGAGMRVLQCDKCIRSYVLASNK